MRLPCVAGAAAVRESCGCCAAAVRVWCSHGAATVRIWCGSRCPPPLLERRCAGTAGQPATFPSVAARATQLRGDVGRPVEKPSGKRGRPPGPSPVESPDSALKFLVRKRPDEAQRKLLIDSATAIANSRSRLGALRRHMEVTRDQSVASAARRLAGQIESVSDGLRALFVNIPSLGEEDARALVEQTQRFDRLRVDLQWAADLLEVFRARDADIDLETLASSAITEEEPWRPFTRYLLWVCMVKELKMPSASELAALAVLVGLEVPTPSRLRASCEKRWDARRRSLLEVLPGLDFNPWTHRPRGA